jgi:hypothetical protein
MDLGARIGRAVDADAAIGRCGPGALPARRTKVRLTQAGVLQEQDPILRIAIRTITTPIPKR